MCVIDSRLPNFERSHPLKSFCSSTLVVVLLLVCTSQSQASVKFELDTAFPEDSSTFKPDPDGTPPWLVAEFEQLAANLVKLTLTADLTSGNNVRGGQGGGPVNWGWGFNFNPLKDLTNLIFTGISGNLADKIGTAGGYKPDGLASEFDILFGWSNSDSFQGTQTAIYNLALSGGGLLESDFNFFSDAITSGNPGVFKSAAHIQGISIDPPGSTWIGGNTEFDPPGGGVGDVPEPMSIAVWSLLAGVAALVSFRLRY